MIPCSLYFQVWRSIWLASYALGLESDIFRSHWLFMATFVHFSHSFSQNFHRQMGESTLYEVYCWNSVISNVSSTVGFGISGQARWVRRRSWSATKYYWMDFAALDNITHIQVCFRFLGFIRIALSVKLDSCGWEELRIMWKIDGTLWTSLWTRFILRLFQQKYALTWNIWDYLKDLVLN